MAKTEPFPITADDRRLAVTTLMKIIETGTPDEQTEAIAVLIEADALNMQAGRKREPREPWMDSIDDD